MRGLTKCLDRHVFSEGVVPFGAEAIAASASYARVPRRGGWAGRGGGRRRGIAVDAQLTRIVNNDEGGRRLGAGGGGRRRDSATRIAPYKLTRMTRSALAELNLRPVVAQRAVVDPLYGVATAADVLALDRKNRLVVVELKCGFEGNKHISAKRGGEPLKFQHPLTGVVDCAYHRHISQLAVTRELLVREKETVRALFEVGVDPNDVRAVLVYANDRCVEVNKLPDWWKNKGSTLLDMCTSSSAP